MCVFARRSVEGSVASTLLFRLMGQSARQGSRWVGAPPWSSAFVFLPNKSARRGPWASLPPGWVFYILCAIKAMYRQRKRCICGKVERLNFGYGARARAAGLCEVGVRSFWIVTIGTRHARYPAIPRSSSGTMKIKETESRSNGFKSSKLMVTA